MTTLGSPGSSSQSISDFSGRKRLQKNETDWDDNARKPRSLIEWVIDDFSPPTMSRGNETRLILAALQAHQKQKLRVCTKTHTMIIICTTSTPLSSIRAFCFLHRCFLHRGKQKLTLYWSNKHAMASRGHAATAKVLFFVNQACKRLK